MKITEMIRDLKKILESEGNLKVCTMDYEANAHVLVVKLKLSKETIFESWDKPRKEGDLIVSLETI